MVLYNFKGMQAVPTAKEFIDIVLSKTQRKTPTVVHKGYQISRIRNFYMRKVKYTQSTYHEKLTKILEDFPRMDDIHPFYADLMNVLYDKDHYKLALGQINTARQLIDKVGKDYLRLLKFADSLYRCKQLKTAALGRMCTIMRKQHASLEYLEQVRQHLSRLPSIDPNTRTLLICGYPNVGKSSFMNKVTRANVEVQPYPFTTKSLFVGHMDYKYLRYQVIDTPGILDQPLEERNTIEMQSVTALAHLRSVIMYFIDPSEQCGYSIEQQIQLYDNIKPLFAHKIVMIIANKSDAMKIEDLSPTKRSFIDKVLVNGVKLYTMSTYTEQGVSDVKNSACEMLLSQRVEDKLRKATTEDIASKLFVAIPKPRDGRTRLPTIPASVVAVQTGQVEKPSRKLEKEIMWEQGGPGVYSMDTRKHYLLDDPSWKDDIIPEIIDGKNIADFIDADILARLEELEAEEDALQRAADGDMDNDGNDLTEEQQAQLSIIRKDRATNRTLNLAKKSGNIKALPRTGRQKTATEFEQHLEEMGIEVSKEQLDNVRSRSRSRSRLGLKRGREESPMFDEEGAALPKADPKARGRSISKSRGDPEAFGLANKRQKIAVEKLVAKGKMAHNKDSGYNRQSEADRNIPSKMPKHLFSGKRSIGKADRR